MTAPAAHAAVCSPWPSCFGSPYQVTGTPDNSLSEWTNSPLLGGSVIRAVSNGYTLWVGCQANDGPQEDGKYNVYPSVPSTTWDFAWDGGISRYVWVYDWWMNTPAQQAPDWYSPGLSHCNFNSPPPSTYTTTMGATETSYSKPDNVHAIGTHTAGSTIHIVCQTNVGAGTGHGYNTPGNFTWDNISEGGWIPDFHVNTPTVGSDGYSAGVPRCHRSGPLSVTSTIASDLAAFPGTPGQAWVVPGNSHTIGPLFNDRGDYWQSVQAEPTSQALASGACQDLVLANSNFWWLFDAVNGGQILNNVDTWGPDSAGGYDPSNNTTYHGYGRTWVTSNPQVGDIVVFGHNSWTPSGHVASVIRVDSDGFVVAEFNWHANGGGNGVLDFRKITPATGQDNVIAFIR